MDDSKVPEEPLVCGIRKSLLERFLLLIRDGYPKVELAACFIEERAGINNVPSMANVRDVLSHLATFLDPSISQEKRAEQISYAVFCLKKKKIQSSHTPVEECGAKANELYAKQQHSRLPT